MSSCICMSEEISPILMEVSVSMQNVLVVEFLASAGQWSCKVLFTLWYLIAGEHEAALLVLEISQREAEINSEAFERRQLRVGLYELAAMHKLFEVRHCVHFNVHQISCLWRLSVWELLSVNDMWCTADRFMFCFSDGRILTGFSHKLVLKNMCLPDRSAPPILMMTNKTK